MLHKSIRLYFMLIMLLTLIGVSTVTAQESVYNEAPQIAEMVANGELPPVEDRLPPEPVVVEPLERVGEYGGILRTVMVGNRAFQVRSAYGPEGLLRVGRDHQTIQPNLARDWEWSEDGLTLTIYLVEGIKWSDGEPFDANGFAYWWNNDILNEELNPTPPTWLSPGGELAEFNLIDDYTFSWTFAVPHPTIILDLAHAQGVNMIPATADHYLQQFHADFADPDELAAKMEEGEFEFWYELYGNRRGDASYGMPRQHVEMPTVMAYKLKSPLQDNLWVLERNPYYWKVDTAGNQLPYIDEVVVTNAESAEVANAMIATGEINFSNGFVTSLDNFPLYAENAEENHYEIRLFRTTEGSALILQPNHTVPDLVLREIFNDVRFKQALSHALDRDTINNVVFQGLGTPAQMHVIEASKFYVEEYANAFTEYNVDLANQLLDEMGLTERDSSGFRLRPDGERLTINLEHAAVKPTYTPLSELLVDMWGLVGIEVNVRVIGDDILEPRILGNEIEFGMWHGDKSSDVLFPTRPDWFVSFQSGWEHPWDSAWALWYDTNGAEGEEPPQEIQYVHETWEQMKQTVDEEEFIRLGQEILRMQAENLWTIGTVGNVPEPMIIGSNLMNYPQEGYVGFDFLGTYPYHAEQLFFEGGRWAGEPE